jgi:phosphatidylserine/phosphatidylglycerophosphate/cardiolipin synthase-like enzyme
MILIDEDFLPQAIALITSAKERIDIATFKAEITPKPRGLRLKQFFQTLFDKRDQGVQVNFLINWNDERRVVPMTNLSAIRDLKQHKINVKILKSNRCCHAKILLVDKDRAIIGSHNLSVRSCHNNFEISYLFDDPCSITRLSTIYDRTLQDAQPAH